MTYKSIKQPNKTHPELQPRIIPAQKRAEQTVICILDTAALLLEEVGLDNFNTNLLAKQADMRIATIYRYFPNKLAILSALVQRWMDTLRVGLLASFSDLADPAKNWRETLDTISDTYIALCHEHIGFIAIRRAMQAAPELRAIELNFVEEFVPLTVEAMQARGVQAEKGKLTNCARVFMIAGSSAIDLAWIIGKENKTIDAGIIEETKLMIISLFANYLD